MKVVELTAPQKTQTAADKAAVATAQAALQAAYDKQQAYLRSLAGAKNTDRVTLDDDGDCIVVG
jgi:hypothetical protein